MKAIKYVEENQHGSMVVVSTQIHVTAVGFAHEGGSDEEELLDWFHLTKAQLHGALAYFYGQRAALIAREDAAAAAVQEMSQKGTTRLQQWRNKQDLADE